MHMNKEQFLQMLQSQQASGLSIKAYCQTNGISVSNFTNWKRKYVLNLCMCLFLHSRLSMCLFLSKAHQLTSKKHKLYKRLSLTPDFIRFSLCQVRESSGSRFLSSFLMSIACLLPAVFEPFSCQCRDNPRL